MVARPTAVPDVPKATAIPTSTSSAFTPTPSPSPVTSPTTVTPSNPGLLQHCLPVKPYRAGNHALQGRIAFLGNGAVGSAYLLDLTTGDKTILSGQAGNFVNDLVVSPDGQWLAYRLDQSDSTASKLIIADSTGQPAQTIPWNRAWRQLSGWLDNNHLWISQARNLKPYQTSDALAVFNPFTREQKVLPTDFPGFSPDDIYPGVGWGRFDWSLLIFDPTLSEVLYPNINGNNLTLWDISHQQMLALITGTTSINITPRWSPDGQQVLIGGPADLLNSPTYINTRPAVLELFSINRRGKLERLTRLADAYQMVDFDNYTWSPNGRLVALPLHTEPNSYPDLYSVTEQQATNRLSIFDMTTRTLTDYCVPDTTLAPPVWSPDGRLLVIEDGRTITENNEFIVDLNDNQAYSLTEPSTPVGWLWSNP
jgi:Tol biopolymer transport system component